MRDIEIRRCSPGGSWGRGTRVMFTEDYVSEAG